MIIRTLTNKPTDSKEAFYFLLCKVNTTNTSEPLPGVLGNKGTGAFIFREQGIFSNYFQGTKELLNRFLGTREHQVNLKVFF